MSIKWLDEKEAERLFDMTFLEWSQQYGYKGCYDDVETREEVVRARVWAAQSKTAIEILNFVLASDKLIYVVGMRGGYQCFNSTEGAEKNLPVVFIDLDGKLTVNVRTPHNLHLDPNRCQANVAPLDNKVALLHEFGHAKQWIETPSMFDNVASGKNVVAPKWGLARRDKGGGQYDARLNKDDFPTAIREKALKLSANRANIPTTAREVMPFSENNPQGYIPPAWPAKVEMDNMSRHEWKICRELFLPLRHNYRDINATSDGAPSLTSQIRQKAMSQAKLDATLQVEKPNVNRIGTVVCPRCKKKVSARNVDKPCGTLFHA